MKKDFRRLQLKHVKSRLDSLKENDLIMRPQNGWIKFIREALGMSAKALASRLKIKPPTLTETEKREKEETISLKKLREVADALNCDLVYYFLPRTDINLMIEERAKHLIKQKMIDIKNHMEMEDQSVSDEFIRLQADELISKLIDSKKLWEGYE